MCVFHTQRENTEREGGWGVGRERKKEGRDWKSECR